ncbi:MAG: glycosyltransferase [Thaumarchaeota archaeon]|nr:glycosyltransferase [Nitrososphaerota archaeon]
MSASESGKGTARVSVVVTAYNNAMSLGECLTSLSAQSFESKDIVIVLDTSSTDDTAGVVDSFSKYNDCRVVKCAGVGRSKARNQGWRSTDSEIVMFADGDDTFERHYLAKAVESLDSNLNAGGVSVGGTALPASNPVLRRYYRSFGGTDARFDERVQADPGWAWVYRRECLADVGGFDESLAQAEDKDLCARVKELGYKISYVGGVNWYHRKPETFSGLIRKECAGGRRRVVFEAKRKDVLSVLLNLAPVAFVVLVLAVIPMAGLLPASLVLVAGVILYMLVAVLGHRTRSGSVSDTVVSSPIAVAAKLAYSLGAVYGLLILSMARAGMSSRDLGRA